MQYFSSQLRAEQETTPSLRASQYKKKRRTALLETEDESSLSPAAQVRTPSGSRTQSHTSIASSELVQLRVAGLLPEEEDDVPPPPFPHASAKASRNHYGSAKVQEEMAKTPSSLYAVNATSKGNPVNGRQESISLRRSHLNNISTLMHRCLLEGDYERAGKALGIILRTHVAGGNPVDPRNQGRWGIAAEILLRRQPKPTTTANEQPRAASQHERDMFSEEGFELAREYYERMIVQHPNRKTHPHVIDERNFYPAMFSLWIYEVCEKSKRARRRIHDDRKASPASDSTSLESLHDDDKAAATAQEDAVQVEELARAMEIAERIDRLIVSPPFDKHTSLLQLRGHVSLWISDLIIGKTALDEDWEMDTSMESDDDPRSAPDQLTRLINGQREVLQARALLKRAEDGGARPEVATMSSIDIRLREVARRIGRLQAPQESYY